MNVIFDLDGVLVDTREAVRQAYKDAGIDMPDDAWGQPWQSWLPELCRDHKHVLAVRARKDLAYNMLIEKGVAEALPPMQLLRVLHNSELARTGILTGASRFSAERIIRHFHLDGIPLYGTSMTRGGKCHALWGVALQGVYIDDNDLMVPEDWRLVRFDPTNDTLDDLMEKLWTP